MEVLWLQVYSRDGNLNHSQGPILYCWRARSHYGPTNSRAPVQSHCTTYIYAPAWKTTTHFWQFFWTEVSHIQPQCHLKVLVSLMYLFHKTTEICHETLQNENRDWRDREWRAPHCQLQPLSLRSKCVWVTHYLWLHTLATGPALTATLIIRMQTHCHNSREAQVSGGANWVRHWVVEQCCRSTNALLKTMLFTASLRWKSIHEPFIPEQCTPHPAPASITKYHPEKASPPGC